MSHQPKKHREHILSFDAAVLLERCQFVEGFNPWNSKIQDTLENDISDIARIEQRFEVETDFSRRQPLPYLLYSRKNALGEKAYLTYQRTPLGGESRLFKDHSIGPGGHVDGEDCAYTEDGLDYMTTIRNNMLREAKEELSWFANSYLGEGVEFDTDTLRTMLENAQPVGWLYDNSNDVGKVHLGIVYEVELPATVYAEIREVQNVFKGYKTLAELRADIANGVSYENWSKLLIEALV